MNRIIAICFLVLGSSSCMESESGCPDATCSDYATQQLAQAAFDTDRECLAGLDSDKDGIACEHLPTSADGNNGCPTTANCGCSSKTQSQCASSCCKWIVGTGCICK